MLRQNTDQFIRFGLITEVIAGGTDIESNAHTGDATLTAILCKTGAAPAASTNSIGEAGSGIYTLELTIAETDTIGDFAIMVTYNGGANVLPIREQVISQAAYDGGSGGDPWTTALPGGYSAGQAGFILGTNLDTTVGSRSTFSGGAVASVTGNVGGNVTGSVGSLTNTACDNVLDRTNGVEAGFTLRQGLRLIAAALAGKVTVDGETVTIRNLADTVDRITATTDPSGERTAVVYNMG